jgi:protein-L-isoaspartate(D-aspartate) O-methyltransferase
LVTAGAPELPKELLQQLNPNGKLVIPIGVKEQKMMRFTRTAKKTFDKESFGNFRFVPLLSDKN